MKRYPLFLLNLFVPFYFGMAQTIIRDVSKDTIWTKFGNPYHLKANMTIHPSATLTIEPGVHIMADKNALIQVKGTLNILGTSTDSVRITASSLHPLDSNFLGIQIDSGGTAFCEYLHASYAKRFLDARPKADLHARHCDFVWCKTGVYSDSMAVAQLDTCSFENNVYGIEQLFRSTVSGSSFVNNAYGVAYANGCIFEGCAFRENSEKGFSGRYNRIIGNRFTEHGNIALELALNEDLVLYQPTEVTRNRFEYNEIGFRLIGSLPTGRFYDNYLCHNRISVYNATEYSPKFSSNCWCGMDSLSIRQSIYDRYKNETKGVVTYFPLSNKCGQFDIPHSINGRFLSPSPLYQLWVYKRENGEDQLIRKHYTSSSYRIDSLAAGDYKLLAIALIPDSTPNPAYMPTVYSQKKSLSNAFVLPLIGDFYDVNFTLLAATANPTAEKTFFKAANQFEGSIVVFEDQQGKATWAFVTNNWEDAVRVGSGWYTVRLHTPLGDWSTSSVYLDARNHYRIFAENDRLFVTLALGITSSNLHSRVKVYPTLLDHRLSIEDPEQIVTDATVFDMMGRACYSFDVGLHTVVDVSTWSSGSYVLRMQNNGSEWHYRLVK